MKKKKSGYLASKQKLHSASCPTNVELNKLYTFFNQRLYADAERLSRSLTDRFPMHPTAWMILGAVLRQLGRLEEALPVMQQTVLLMPDDAMPHSNLGVIYKDMDRLKDAETCFRRALEIMPDFAEAFNNLGNTLKNMGRMNEAEACYHQALKIKPGYAEAHNNLGNTLKSLGRLDEAALRYRMALNFKPDFADAHYNLGNTFRALDRLKEAEDSFLCALKIMPGLADAHFNLANTLKEMGQFKTAETSYRRALELRPDFVDAACNLGNLLNIMGRLEEAELCYQRALKYNPEFADAHYNLGNNLRDQGKLAEAEASYRIALQISPDSSDAFSNLLFTMCYSASHHISLQLEESIKYGQLVSQKVKTRYSTWQCTPQPHCLRVGVVSGDLYNHPVGYFLESTLSQINPSSIELIAYPTGKKTDELTSRIRPWFSAWKSLSGLNDEEAARLIHEDGVHVLLDLSGHTGHNRLPMFAWKPAPVQTTWLGYLATTGVAEIDYIIGDHFATPLENDLHFSEKVWRLPDVWGCFTPPLTAAEIAPLPALRSGSITFGCFNNLNKLNDAVIALWARVLVSVPGSRLFLKTKQLDNPTACAVITQRFADHGIESGRLILEGYSPRAELLTAYNRVDIALDPFPYSGGTTNFEILWMAVPIISLKGDRFTSRGGYSVLCNAGLSDWVAENMDNYVSIAVNHSHNLERLANLRSILRQQVLASPLFDSGRFARQLETALWGMWNDLKSL